MDLSGEITSWEPPHAFTWRPLDPPFPISGGWTLVADGTSPRVTRHSQTELTGLMKAMS